MTEPTVTLDLVLEHGLPEAEYNHILDVVGRPLTYTELGIMSVMWSEHCSYKNSKLQLKKFPTTGPQVLQGPGENAGIVDIGDGYAITFKMESHNHPSAIEPYQGAATGVGGILRDVFTMGARPIALLNSLRFGSLTDDKVKYLFSHVVKGIGDYGNCIGVPTVGGEVYFDESFTGNPLVNAMCVGLMKHDEIVRGTASGVGNPVIAVGAKTGRDGIHGATFASEELTEASEEKRPSVQVGDPFTEKLLLEATLELIRGDHIVGIQDMGAAGLISSSSEMASRAGSGIEIHIDRVPQRETGMTPYEILLSESQERMLVVAKKGHEDHVADIFKKWDLDTAVIGAVTDSGNVEVFNHGQRVAQLPVDLIVTNVPVYERDAQRPAYMDKLAALTPNDVPLPTNLNGVLQQLISSPNIASKRWVYQQYDSQVRTNTVVLPGSDAAVMRIRGTRRGVALTTDCNSRYVYLDPFVGGQIAVAESARNLVCSGAKPLGITNCLNFGNPYKPEIYYQFSQAIEGMSEACRVLDTPVTGGNVSFYNENPKGAVHPTPTVGMVGVLEDIERHCTQWFKDSGDLIYFLGETKPEIGGSEYLAQIHNRLEGKPPAIDLAFELKIQQTCLHAIQKGWLKSAHDCAEGGLAVAIAESCITHPERVIGATVKLDDELRADFALFSESQSRIVVSIAPEQQAAFEAHLTDTGLPWATVGTVGGNTLRINDWIDVSVDILRERFLTAIERQVGDVL